MNILIKLVSLLIKHGQLALTLLLNIYVTYYVQHELLAVCSRGQNNTTTWQKLYFFI